MTYISGADRACAKIAPIEPLVQVEEEIVLGSVGVRDCVQCGSSSGANERVGMRELDTGEEDDVTRRNWSDCANYSLKGGSPGGEAELVRLVHEAEDYTRFASIV